MYRPEGNPEVTGEVPPTEVHEGPASPFANELPLALTSKDMSVLLSSVSSQNRPSHLVPPTPLSRTWEAMVPEEPASVPANHPERQEDGGFSRRGIEVEDVDELPEG